MKILLDEEDIKTLIENNYNGVTDIKLPNDLEIAVTVDSESFTKVQQRASVNNNPQPYNYQNATPLTQDKKNILEAKQGTMASGGVRRTLTKMG